MRSECEAVNLSDFLFFYCDYYSVIYFLFLFVKSEILKIVDFVNNFFGFFYPGFYEIGLHLFGIGLQFE